MRAQHVASQDSDQTHAPAHRDEPATGSRAQRRSPAFERRPGAWMPTSSGWFVGQIVLPVILGIVAIAAIVVGAIAHAL